MNLLTLASARLQLWAYGPARVPYGDATSDQIEEFDNRLSQVVERYLSKMKPALLYRRVQVPIYDHNITLPRGLQSLLGLRPVNDDNCACGPLMLYSRFHEFAQLGAGSLCGCGCNGGVFPVSETTQTFRDPSPGFLLRVKSDTDGGTVTFIGGFDTDWNEFYDNASLSITAESTTTREWGGMPRISKSETTSSVQLYSVDGDGVETLISVYAPGETDPAYQRYRLPDLPNNVNTARILSRLTFVPLMAATDIVIPSRIGALKMGLKALNYEDTDDIQRAAFYWNSGMDIINSDKQEFEGDNQIPLVDAAYGFGASTVYNVI